MEPVKDPAFDCRDTLIARQADPPNCSALAEIANGSSRDLPDNDEVHALGTDVTSLAERGGLIIQLSRINPAIRPRPRIRARYGLFEFFPDSPDQTLRIREISLFERDGPLSTCLQISNYSVAVIYSAAGPL